MPRVQQIDFDRCIENGNVRRFGDLLRPADLSGAFRAHRMDLVMHFAANCCVGESVQDPRKYYRNGGQVESARRHAGGGVTKFVFSSSCASYGVPGVPQTESIDESHPQRLVNPYGRTKLMVEHRAQTAPMAR